MTALIARLRPGAGRLLTSPSNVDPDKSAALISQTCSSRTGTLRPVELASLERDNRESLAGRTGGAVTLARRRAKVFSPHARHAHPHVLLVPTFIIMFEALFILTLLETGTPRVARSCSRSGHQPGHNRKPGASPTGR